VIDGTASIRQLATDVHEEVGIPVETAQHQMIRVVESFAQAGLLASSTSSPRADEAILRRELFVASSTPCSENSSRLGTETLVLGFGERTVRVACDARRGVRLLRTALDSHLLEADVDVPLAFVLTAPQGLKRTHLLTDRSGFALSRARGLDAGLHALASHLTALLPPEPGTVRIRARAIVSGDRTIVCLFPLLYFPVIPERDLARADLRLVDRLALDIDVSTGHIVNPEIPWPMLRELGAAPAHVGTGGSRAVTAVVAATPPVASPPPTQAAVAAQLAASGLHGSTADLVDAAVSLVKGAALRSTQPAAEPFIDLLEELRSPDA
jgi:hypothetical protein